MSVSARMNVAVRLWLLASIPRAVMSGVPDHSLSWSCVLSSIQSLDPIVNPGAVGTVRRLRGRQLTRSKHAHLYWGSDGFAPSVSSPNGARDSTCTSCTATEDHSMYWAPSLYVELSDGSYQSLPEPDFRYTYAWSSNAQPLPTGLRMIAGKNTARQEKDALDQKYANWTCSDDGSITHGFPINKKCKKLTASLVFPSCSNGQLDTGDHQSHMAYPGDNGDCPSGFSEVPRISFSISWDTSSVFSAQTKEPDQPYVFSMGDGTGYGLHGDIISGWKDGVQAAFMDQCGQTSSTAKRQFGGFGSFGGSGSSASSCPPVSDNPISALCRRTPYVNQLAFSDSPMVNGLPGCSARSNGPDSQAACSPAPSTDLLLDKSQTTVYIASKLRPFSPFKFIRKLSPFKQQVCTGQL